MVEPPDTEWIELQVAHQRTPSKPSRDGTRVRFVRFDNREAEAIMSTLRFNGVLGFRHGLDTWVALPSHRLEVNNAQAH